MAPAHVVDRWMSFVGQGVEHHRLVRVVVSEGRGGLSSTTGSGTRTRHARTLSPGPVLRTDRGPVASPSVSKPAEGSGGKVPPSSRTNAPGGSRAPKGRVPVASTPPAKSRGRGSKAPAKASRTTAAQDAGTEGTATAEGEIVAKPRYGGGALVIAFLGAQLLSSLAYMLVNSTGKYDFNAPAGVGAAVGQAAGQFSQQQPFSISVPPPLWVTALMQIPLWLGLAAIPIWFAVKKGRGVVADLGLRMKMIDIPIGLAIGVACQLIMVPLVYLILRPLLGVKDISAAARELTDRATDPLSIVLVFLIVGIGAPIAEEIYFRGMAQRIFGRRLSPAWAIVAAAAFFAATHLQPLQFPALFVFGGILGFMAWRSGRLGPAIWAHLGFNVVAAAGLLFHFGPG
jgi:membrane protease YdiL (CAAX protease family)